VLVRGHQPHGPAAQAQHAGPADQGDVVEVDDVGVDRVERRAQRLGLEDGAAGDLGGQGREDPRPLSRRWTCKPGGGV
jgi:hypothetical protein